jgi:hypothetical protein
MPRKPERSNDAINHEKCYPADDQAEHQVRAEKRLVGARRHASDHTDRNSSDYATEERIQAGRTEP